MIKKRTLAILLACMLIFGGTSVLQYMYASGMTDSIAKAEETEGGDTDAESTVQANDADASSYTVSQDGYSISTSNELATMTGAAVLESGGNAVDAAIAVAYVLGVVEPYGSGIGGGGGMLVYDPDSGFNFLNYYSMAAPSGATSNNISVPGFVSGMQTAHDLYGTMDMEDLISYAISYAEDGIEVTSEIAYRIKSASKYMDSSMPMYKLKEGDTLVQEDLAETMRLIAAEGADAFYSGVIGEDVVKKTALTSSDLASYTTLTAEPVSSEVVGYTVVSSPAPCSGLTLIQMMKLMELADVPDPEEDPEGYLSALVDIKMTTGSIRYNTICDTSYTGDEIDYDALLDDEYLASILGIEVAEYDEETESEDTTHVSIVDSNGMVVSMTNTLSSFWGSKVYVDGFFMGNNIINFSGGVNSYAPGKRPRTFTSPTIILSDDGSVMAAGSPGGNVIVNVLATVLTDNLLYGTDIQEAVDKQRVVVRSYSTLMIETGLDHPQLADTDGLGYMLVRNSNNRQFGSVNIAGYSTEDGYYATTDERRSGYGYAYNPGEEEEEENTQAGILHLFQK